MRASGRSNLPCRLRAPDSLLPDVSIRDKRGKEGERGGVASVVVYELVGM